MIAAQEIAQKLTEQTEKIIVGKTDAIQKMLMSIFAEGHILLEDMPGVGKTTLIKTMSIALGCSFKRVQFTPDLLPSDVLGMNIYNQKTGEFQLMEGPVMTNLLLADEINRAIPRTQAALLEAMEEKQVTIDGVTRPLPRPFVVMATQNPVESESTFQLPAAQMDRFFVRLSLGYPGRDQERQMLLNLGDEIPFDRVERVTDAEELTRLQKEIQGVILSDTVAGYIVALAEGTRNHPLVAVGVSPRGSRALFKGAKAWAAMQGRDFVTPDDVKAIAPDILIHRLILSGEARLAGRDAGEILTEILGSVSVPPAREEIFDGN